MNRLLLCFALVLAGCSSQPTASRNHERAIRAASQSYTDCMLDAGQQFVTSAASSYEIADAAHGKCGDQFIVYQRTVENYFVDTLPKRYSRASIHSEVRQRTNETRQRAQGLVIQTVVEARAK